MLSVKPIFSNSNTSYKNNNRTKMNSNYAFTSFKGAPINVEKQVLPDLRGAITNAMTGIFQKAYNNGQRVEIELKNGKKIAQRIFDKSNDYACLQIFKNRKLKTILKEYNGEIKVIETYSNNNMVRLVKKDKKGHIICDQRNRYGKDNILINSTTRHNVAKFSSQSNFNDIGQLVSTQINFDKGLSQTYKYVNAHIHQKILSAPNGASCTTTFYHGIEMPESTIGQFNNYRKIEHYSPDGELTSSLTDYEGQTLKIYEIDKNCDPVKGTLIDLDGATCGVEFQRKEGIKCIKLYDIQSGEQLQVPKEISEWFNDLEINDYEITKMLYDKHIAYTDSPSAVYKKLKLYTPDEISEKNKAVLNNMIPNIELIPTNPELRKLYSN